MPPRGAYTCLDVTPEEELQSVCRPLPVRLVWVAHLGSRDPSCWWNQVQN